MNAPPVSSRRSLWWPLLVVSALACGDSGDPAAPPPSVPTSIEMSQRSITLYVPGTANVSAAVHDQSGAVMPAEPVVYQSRDTTTVRVDSAGLLTAIAGGETWAVATSGALSDSVAVDVRYPVQAGEARSRLRTSRGQDRFLALDPSAQFQDVLGGDADDRSALVMSSTSGSYLSLAVVIDGSLDPRTADIEELDLADALGDADYFEAPKGGLVFIPESTTRNLVYTSLHGSRLEIDAEEAAPAMGMTGTVRGRLVLRALGYVLDATWQSGEPTGDTLTLYVDFATEYVNFGVGTATVTVDGGPVGSGVIRMPAWYLPETSGLGGYLDAGGDPSVDLYLDEPAVETVALRPADPSTPPRSSYGPYLAVRSYETQALGYSQSGDATIDAIQQPNGEAWGEMSGRARADVAYWTGYSYGDPVASGTISLEFDAPILPPGYGTAAEASPTDAERPMPRWNRLLDAIPRIR